MCISEKSIQVRFLQDLFSTIIPIFIGAKKVVKLIFLFLSILLKKNFSRKK